MSENTSLWPKVSVSTKMPVNLLREQAEYLGKQTGGLLEGRVDVMALGQLLRLTFVIVVPSLNEYQYRLFDVTHGIDGYPAKFMIFDEEWPASNEAEFTIHLGNALTDERTQRVVEQLLALVS